MQGWITALLCACLVGVTLPAHAEQRRDYMFERIPAGDSLTVDYFGTGGQLSLDKHQPIYGTANDVSAGVSTLLTYPFGQLSAYAHVRVLFLEFGGSVGYRGVWRNLHFDAGKSSYCDDCKRGPRRDRDPIFGRADTSTDRYAFAEGQLRLYAPVNEFVFFVSELAARVEDSQERSYDWINANIHDGGVVGRSETTLFVKHRDWGGIGPYVQVMFLPRAHKHETEVAVGFNLVARLGLIDRDDLLFLTFLTRPGDPYYGQHAYYSPVRALLVYRITLAL